MISLMTVCLYLHNVGYMRVYEHASVRVYRSTFSKINVTNIFSEPASLIYGAVVNSVFPRARGATGYRRWLFNYLFIHLRNVKTNPGK